MAKKGEKQTRYKLPPEITQEEYRYYYDVVGVRKPMSNKVWVKVVYDCAKCQKEHKVVYHWHSRRTRENQLLCAACCIQQNGSDTAARNIESGFMLDSQIIENIEGIKCASYGESTFVQWKLSKGFKVTNTKIRIPYILNGIKRFYNPDFCIEKVGRKPVLIEVKCDYLCNFKKTSKEAKEQLTHRLGTYGLDELNAKIKAAKLYCKINNLRFQLVTLDNREFQLLYHAYLRRKRSIKYENKKQKNNPI